MNNWCGWNGETSTQAASHLLKVGCFSAACSLITTESFKAHDVRAWNKPRIKLKMLEFISFSTKVCLTQNEFIKLSHHSHLHCTNKCVTNAFFPVFISFVKPAPIFKGCLHCRKISFYHYYFLLLNVYNLIYYFFFAAWLQNVYRNSISPHRNANSLQMDVWPYPHAHPHKFR